MRAVDKMDGPAALNVGCRNGKSTAARKLLQTIKEAAPNEHFHDGATWTFNSDWHEYGIAQFQMEKVDTNRFEGYAYLDGEQRPYRHILLRVGD